MKHLTFSYASFMFGSASCSNQQNKEFETPRAFQDKFLLFQIIV